MADTKESVSLQVKVTSPCDQAGERHQSSKHCGGTIGMDDKNLAINKKLDLESTPKEADFSILGNLPISEVDRVQVVPVDESLKPGNENKLMDGGTKESGCNVGNEICKRECDVANDESGSHIGARGDVLQSTGFVDCEEKSFDYHSAQCDEIHAEESEEMLSVDEIKTEIVADASSRSLSEAEEKRLRKNAKKFFCDVCFAGFPDNGGLNRHKRIHTGEKPFTCDICAIAFTWSGGLRSHRRIHTGEKPYKCDVCSMEFSHCSNLKTHKRTHTREKPFVCDVCEARFGRHSDLERHKLTHSGEKNFKCDICWQEFTSCSDLMKHTRVHTGEKPYKCDICDKGFSRCCSLNRHRRVHTGEKPYKCDSCVAEFAQCSDLSRHKKVHDGSRPIKKKKLEDESL